MRIISGKFKGRVLNEFRGKDVRPTSDMARESLFNIIDVENKSFLDLFAGTGAVGIEALSRGADKVVFNDDSKESVSLIKSNLSKLGINGEVSFSDALGFLMKTDEKFDFVFIDAPYTSGLGEKALEIVSRVLKDNGVAILENENLFTYFPKGLYKADERKYGRAVLTFFKKTENKNCVFAGTFDPVSKGHESIIKKCIFSFNKVFVVIGDNEDKVPLLSLEDRVSILKETFKDYENVCVVKYSDYKEKYGEFLKDNNVLYYVRGIRCEEDLKYEKKYEKINKVKYPDIITVYLNSDKEYKNISSTLIRKAILKGKSVKEFLPEKTCDVIEQKLKENRID